MRDTLHLTLLGIPELRAGGGEAVQFRTRKQMALFIYLALEARTEPATRDKLVDLIWPDSPQDKALHSLSQGLTEIRKKVGSEALAANRLSVQLRIDISFDLDGEPGDSSAQLAAVPLEGMESSAGRRFADWVEVTRAAILTRIRAKLSEQLSEARSHGRVSAVRERAELLYNVDPHSDAAVQALAEERFSSGDWAGGIRLVSKHINDSERELGRRPSADVLATLRRFERGLLRDPITGEEEETEGPRIASGPQVFVDREAEMARLQALLYEIEDGHFRTCALRGPDGIGKSAILRRFALSTATRGVPTYLACCQEIGKNIPFAAVSDLLEQLARDPSLSSTDPVWLAEASRVSPRIKVAYPGVPEPPSTAPETVRLRLAQALKAILETVADGCPLLLGFDDIHYMDPASREVLHILARRLEGTATLLMAAVRCSETELALGGGEGLKGVYWQETIAVNPLDDSHTAELIRAISDENHVPDGPGIERLIQLAQGNPYLTEMLVADWRENGERSIVSREDLESFTGEHWRPSDTMRRAFERQTQALSNDALHLLELMATAGRALPVEHLACVLGFEVAAANRAALELVERSLIRVDQGALELRSQVHRTYIYGASMSDETRKFYHAALTEFFKATRDERDFQRGLEASHHAVKAGMLAEAVKFVSAGAESAISSGAPKEAESALTSVVDCWPGLEGVEVTILLAKAYSAQGAYDRCLGTLDGIGSACLSDTHVATVAHMRAEALHRGRLAPDVDTTVLAVELAMQSANAIGDDRLALKAQQIGAEIAHESGRCDVLRMIEEECVRVEQEAQDTEVRGLANLTLGYCRLVSGRPSSATDFFSHSAQLFRIVNQDAKVHRALNGLGMSASSIGDYLTALDAFRGAAALADRTGDSVAHANALLNIGSISNELGQFRHAAECFRRAVELDLAISSSRVSTALYCNAANLSIVIGNLCEADTLLERAAQGADRSKLWHHSVSVRLTQADLNLARGKHVEALNLVQGAIAITGDRHRLVPDLGQYWRLRRLYYSSTGSGDATAVDNPTLMTMAHLLELQAFEESNNLQSEADSKGSTALDELVQHGLYGVIARLVAVRVPMKQLGVDRKKVSGAQETVRAFPNRQWQDIPSAVLS